MIWNGRFFKVFLALVATSVVVTSMAQTHVVNRRQIGVLARKGALPQGKRSTAFDLPGCSSLLETQPEPFDFIIEELRKPDLQRAKALKINLHLKNLLEGQNAMDPGGRPELLSSDGEEEGPGFSEDKRSAEVITGRSGYLIKPSQKPPRQTLPPLDPDEFFAGTQFRIDSEPSDNTDGESPETSKTLLSRVNGALHSGNEGSFREMDVNFYNKRNLASLARDGGFSSLRYSPVREQDWLNEFGPGTDHEYPGNVAANGVPRGKRPQVNQQFPREAIHGDTRGHQTSDPDLPLNPFQREGNLPEKRFLGRIPQLGRTHRKVQAQPIRRRPHLRPNWL